MLSVLKYDLIFIIVVDGTPHSILQNILLWCDLLIILGATNSTDTSFIVQKFLNACCNNKIFGTTVNNVKFVSFAQFPTSHSNYNTEFN